jgi:hypothetical protein
MKTTREYDFNVWSTGEKIFLTAYELKEDITGQADWLILNASRYQSISWVVGDPKNAAIIEWLTGDLKWDGVDFTDYDEWTHLASLEDANPPMEIKRWLDQLPEYEVYVG